MDPEKAPTGTASEFLPVCGVWGLGRLLAEGRMDLLPHLRKFASDPRWRMREVVYIALQGWGDKDFDALLAEMESWSQGSLLEQRAAAASLCEPRLLNQERAVQVLRLLYRITSAAAAEPDRKQEPFRVLQKGLGYCWSVAFAAAPEEGKQAMQKWFSSVDPVVLRIMRENLMKNRLMRIAPDWAEKSRSQIDNSLIILKKQQTR